MFDLEKLFNVCDKIAPLAISKKMVGNGEYDNSGILVREHEQVSGVLFSLDLSDESIKQAKKLKCDTIVTHHPAIYYPIKNLDYKNAMTAPLINAVKNKMNVISMHLNLDASDDGIDHNLALGLGAKQCKTLEYIDGEHGYGREFGIKEIEFSKYVQFIKCTFNTNKIIAYGKNKDKVKIVASFCGGGASFAEDAVLNNKTVADTIVTSDMPHHDVKYLIESGKKIIIIPHYVAENFGFRKFYANCKNEIDSNVGVFFFEDKRFC